MKWKVIISAPYLQPVLARFQPIFDANHIQCIVPPVNERMSEEELLEYIGDADGIICGDDRLTQRVLQSAPRLKVISKWGTGIDSIDQVAAARLGIAVRNTPNAFSEPVADTVLGYLLCFARQIPWMDRDLRSGSWVKRPSISLGECTLGVIGVGNVGKAVVRRAVAFGMRVLGHDLMEVPAEFIECTGLQVTSKPQLLNESDFVTLHCDLNPSSFHLMSEADFAQMKPGAYVINTSRGPVVDEDALVRALRSGQVAGAALDVFEDEPLPPDSPLRTFDNVLLAPHNANSSPVAWERVHENTINNLLQVLVQRSEEPTTRGAGVQDGS